MGRRSAGGLHPTRPRAVRLEHPRRFFAAGYLTGIPRAVSWRLVDRVPPSSPSIRPKRLGRDRPSSPVMSPFAEIGTVAGPRGRVSPRELGRHPDAASVLVALPRCSRIPLQRIPTPSSPQGMARLGRWPCRGGLRQGRPRYAPAARRARYPQRAGTPGPQGHWPDHRLQPRFESGRARRRQPPGRNDSSAGRAPARNCLSRGRPRDKRATKDYNWTYDNRLPARWAAHVRSTGGRQKPVMTRLAESRREHLVDNDP